MEVVPFGSAKLYYMLSVHLFLLPQPAPHREHTQSPWQPGYESLTARV